MMRKKIRYIVMALMCVILTSSNITVFAKNNNDSIISTHDYYGNSIMTVIDSGVNLRAQAGLNYSSLGMLYYGEKVSLVEQTVVFNNGYYWRHVKRLSDGTTGWVASIYLR